MTVNRYLQNGNGIGDQSEQNLVQDLVDETIQAMGHEFFYIPRVMVKEDKIFGEDVLSSFTGYYTIEMYFNNINDWGGQDDLLAKFGLMTDHTAELIVSRKRFAEEADFLTPREGDLIYFPLAKSLLQIDHVEYENPFYQLGKRYTFMIKCSLYTYSHEQFTTGITPVDSDLDNQTFDGLFGNNEDINTEAETQTDFSEAFPFGEIIEN